MSLYIGLMSGTSADALDGALLRLADHQPPQLLGAHSITYTSDFQARLRQLALAETVPAELLLQTERQLAQLSVELVQQLLAAHRIDAVDVHAIGSHGHTIRHFPQPTGMSWQMNDPSFIAEHTGITCIADFRRRDIAAGGEGAPLVPAFHQACFGQRPNSAVLNLGGIANLTLLQQPLLGFDCGPGNALLDEYCQARLNISHDDQGQLARQGTVHQITLGLWLQDAFLQQPPPKSTGREHFQLSQFPVPDELSPEDALATLTEFTAVAIANALQQSMSAPCETLWVCGGGWRNTILIERLQQHLPSTHISSTAEQGIDPQWMEAMAFAWLAQQALANKTSNVPSVTGAKGERILGGIYPSR